MNLEILLQQKKHLGLTNPQVTENLHKYGYNELPSEKSKNAIKILFDVLKEPMFVLLISCGIIYLYVGDTTEALVLLSSILIIITTTFYQEHKTEKTLQSLKELTAPKTTVIREQQLLSIPSREVVPHDLIVLKEGDKVPADAEVLEAENLYIDESALTGESASINKLTGDLVSYGTLVLQGDAIVKVKHTGVNTQIGNIGKALSKIDDKQALIQDETGRIVKFFTLEAIILCVALVLFNIAKGHPITKSVLEGLTLAMSAIPEEFPVILTIFMALGAWRLSKSNVLTRRVPIIETLGAITVLCVDKTGTLTKNSMTLKQLYNNKLKGASAEDKLEKDMQELVFLANISSKETPFDPMEKSLRNIGKNEIDQIREFFSQTKLLKEYPIDHQVTAITKVYNLGSNTTDFVVSKGAPESILRICKISKKDQEKVLKTVQDMSTKGLRVLAVAQGEITKGWLPETQDLFKLQFKGLVGFADPVKSNVSEALKECYDAGIKVKMLTGDYPGTAISIANQIKMQNPSQFLLGENIENLHKENDSELKKLISKINIFARVKPLQKFYLVKHLIAQNEIVAMTGDGVNDAPALKEAHVGISMGKRGTDVAREASALVLTDDDFSTIVKGIKTGRTIYSNIKKGMKYVFTIHIPIAAMALVPIILGLPTFFFPIHIVFLEFLIDPISTIVFEAEPAEKNIMRNPPRKLSTRIFDFDTILSSIARGSLIFATTFISYVIFLRNSSPDYARTVAFVSMVLANLLLVIISRSETELVKNSIKNKNRPLWVIVGFALLILITSTNIPFVREMFRFSRFGFLDYVTALFIALVSAIWIELFKFVRIVRNS